MIDTILKILLTVGVLMFNAFATIGMLFMCLMLFAHAPTVVACIISMAMSLSMFVIVYDGFAYCLEIWRN